jgi:hypothetical protein
MQYLQIDFRISDIDSHIFLTGLQNDGLNKALESIRNMAESIIRAQVQP